MHMQGFTYRGVPFGHRKGAGDHPFGGRAIVGAGDNFLERSVLLAPDKHHIDRGLADAFACHRPGVTDVGLASA